MKNLLTASILTLGLLSNIGCYKDLDNTPEPTVIIEKPDIKISTELHGVVIGLDGMNADNYNVNINGQSYSSEQEVFFVELENANKKNQHISISQQGEEIAFANVSLIENDNNKIELQVLPQWSTNSISDNNNLVLNDELTVELNSDIQEVTYGLISDDKLIQQLGVWGIGQNNEDYFLETKTAFYLNTENLATNSSSLNYNFTSNQLSANAALFHLNETFHQWVLVDKINTNNGSINLPDNGYYLLANITTSTFAEGQLSFEQLPLAFQTFDLSLLNNQTINFNASANGRWSSFLPIDVLGKISINDPCGNEVIQEEIDIVEGSQTFETALTESDSENFVKLNFQDIECEGEVITSPGSIINFGSTEKLMVFDQESVELAVLSCGDITVRGYDIINNQEGPSIPWDSEIEDELGYLSVCEEYSEGFSYLKINGEMEMLKPFILEKENNRSILKSQENNIRIIIKGEGVGSYEVDQVNFFMDLEGFGSKGYRMDCENSAVGCGIDDCYISHYEEIGNGMTRITFSGVLWMQTILDPTAGNYEVEGQIITTL